MILMMNVVWLACSLGLSAQTDNRQPAAEAAVPILLYHSVAEDPQDPLSVTPARLEQEMSYLRDRGYHPLQFADLQAWGAHPLPSKPVLITMDDGYENQFTAAFPILKRTGMKATIFAITGNMGKPGYLTWRQLRTMEASGTVDTQSHTVNHPDLTKLSFEAKSAELSQSRRVILHELGHPAVAFAYPYGLYDKASIEAVRLAGYRYAVTGEPGYAQVTQGLLTLHRILITGGMPLKEFQERLP